MKTTELVAWIGASTGIASLIWNIYSKVTANRPKLIVRAYANMVQMPPPPKNPRFLRITVQNNGTTPTTITNVEFFKMLPLVVPPPNDTPPLAYTFYYKRGTPMTEQLCLLVRPPKDASGSYTIENQLKDVLAHAKTFEDIAIKWKNIDAQKTIVEKLDRMNRYVGDPRLNLS